MDLSELRKQVDEDERIARSAPPGPWEFSDRGWQLRLTADEPNFERIAAVEQPTDAQQWAFLHISCNGPDRALREVAAKRAILDEYEADHGLAYGPEYYAGLMFAIAEMVTVYGETRTSN